MCFCADNDVCYTLKMWKMLKTFVILTYDLCTKHNTKNLKNYLFSRKHSCRCTKMKFSAHFLFQFVQHFVQDFLKNVTFSLMLFRKKFFQKIFFSDRHFACHNAADCLVKSFACQFLPVTVSRA